MELDSKDESAIAFSTDIRDDQTPASDEKGNILHVLLGEYTRLKTNLFRETSSSSYKIDRTARSSFLAKIHSAHETEVQRAKDLHEVVPQVDSLTISQKGNFKNEEEFYSVPIGNAQPTFDLDTNLDDMTGIVDTSHDGIIKQYGRTFTGPEFFEEPKSGIKQGAWEAPDSWAARKVEDAAVSRLTEIDEAQRPSTSVRSSPSLPARTMSFQGAPQRSAGGDIYDTMEGVRPGPPPVSRKRKQATEFSNEAELENTYSQSFAQNEHISSDYPFIGYTYKRYPDRLAHDSAAAQELQNQSMKQDEVRKEEPNMVDGSQASSAYLQQQHIGHDQLQASQLAQQQAAAQSQPIAPSQQMTADFSQLARKGPKQMQQTNSLEQVSWSQSPYLEHHQGTMQEPGRMRESQGIDSTGLQLSPEHHFETYLQQQTVQWRQQQSGASLASQQQMAPHQQTTGSQQQIAQQQQYQFQSSSSAVQRTGSEAGQSKASDKTPIFKRTTTAMSVRKRGGRTGAARSINRSPRAGAGYENTSPAYGQGGEDTLPQPPRKVPRLTAPNTIIDNPDIVTAANSTVAELLKAWTTVKVATSLMS